jgi:uncharacterized protein YjbI with pentapeptide repeats
LAERLPTGGLHIDFEEEAMGKARFINDEAFRSLRAGDAQAFHRMIERRSVVDFTDADLRGTDFREVDLSKVILRGAYLKDADLRGMDLRKVDLEGASIHNARIGGTYFSTELSAEEIALSVKHGTRMRTGKRDVQ